MKLRFILDYQTVYGEEIVLNMLAADGSVNENAMKTDNGSEWKCEITIEENCTQLDYY